MANLIPIQNCTPCEGDHVIANFNLDTGRVELLAISGDKKTPIIFDPSVAIQVGRSGPTNGVGSQSTRIAVNGKIPTAGNDSSVRVDGLPVSMFNDIVEAGRALQDAAAGLIPIEDIKIPNGKGFGDRIDHVTAHFNPATGNVRLVVRASDEKTELTFDPSVAVAGASIKPLPGNLGSSSAEIAVLGKDHRERTWVTGLPLDVWLRILETGKKMQRAHSGPSTPESAAGVAVHQPGRVPAPEAAPV